MVSKTDHPLDDLVRSERLPHIWCPGCGLGIVLSSYLEAVRRSGIDTKNHVVVSGIGCTGRIAGYTRLDSYHTIHGRAIPFATGLKIANPELEVTVISGDGDLFNIGGNHIMHAIRRNVDLNIFCVNNFNYGMTGGQFGATTPTGARTKTTPFGNIEQAFNLPYLASALGASFVSRWSTMHIRQLLAAMEAAISFQGLSFLEIISPCPPTFGKLNQFPDAFDSMQYFKEKCITDDGADLRSIGLTMHKDDNVVLGNFRNEEKPSYIELEKKVIQSYFEAEKNGKR